MEEIIKEVESRIEIKSDSVNEILSKPPRWMVRWGITALFSILLIILVGSAFFSYPDIISAPVIITSSNLPVQMISRASGRISFFVKESETVQKGKIVAYIDNPTVFKDYMALKKALPSSGQSPFNIKEESLELGSLQDSYQNLLSIIKEYKEFKVSNYHNKKLKLLEKQLRSQKQSSNSLHRQVANSNEQLKIAGKMLERDSLLFIQKAISSLDFEKSKSSYLTAIQQQEGMLSAYNSTQTSITQNEQTIFDTQQEKINREKNYTRTALSALEVLKSKIAEWDQSYLLISPLQGKVSLTQYWQNNQNINSGEMLMTIIPAEKSYVIGKVYLPLKGAGKVKRGQKVNIKLDNYPYMEFGLLQTTISNISSSPIIINNQNQLVISLDFKDSLVTNYHITIPINEDMTGTSDIITKDKSAFERIISPVKYLLNKK